MVDEAGEVAHAEGVDGVRVVGDVGLKTKNIIGGRSRATSVGRGRRRRITIAIPLFPFLSPFSSSLCCVWFVCSLLIRFDLILPSDGRRVDIVGLIQSGIFEAASLTEELVDALA